MHFIGEATIADIAECLGINKDIVKMKILRARRILQHKLYNLTHAKAQLPFRFLISDLIALAIV